MAKNYIIELSSITCKTMISEADKDGKIINVEKSTREIELITLKNLFRFARNKEASIDTGCLITDCLDQLDNITDKETLVKFTEQDIGFLKTGYKISAEERVGLINFWFDNCKTVMQQIRKPIDEEEYEKQKVEIKKKEK